MADQSFSNSARLRVPARGFLHGSVGVEQIRGGFIRPLRITPEQLRVLGSVAALHPGQFRGMAACTAGITLEFDTDASTEERTVLYYTNPIAPESDTTSTSAPSGKARRRCRR